MINDDWRFLNLTMVPGPEDAWARLFEDRQRAIQDLILSELSVLSEPLLKIIVAYTRRKWCNFELGDLLKVWDFPLAKWMPAIILEIEKENYLLIHYFGWHSKWNEYLDPKSQKNRIMPLDKCEIGVKYGKHHLLHSKILRKYGLYVKS